MVNVQNLDESSDIFSQNNKNGTQAKETKDESIQAEKTCWIFDLDGTLLDDITPLKEFFYDEVPSKFARKDLTPVEKDLMQKKVMEFISGLKVSAWAILKQLMWYGKRLGLNFFQRFRMLKYIKNNINKVLKNSDFFEGTVESLKTLIITHGCPVAINTSSSDEEIRIKMKGRDNVLEMFEPLVISRDSVSELKPAAESIELIAEKVGISPSQCIMFGDMPVDIECAQNAGACSVAVLGGFLNKRWIKELDLNPDFVFKNIKEAVDNYDKIINHISRKKA